MVPRLSVDWLFPMIQILCARSGNPHSAPYTIADHTALFYAPPARPCVPFIISIRAGRPRRVQPEFPFATNRSAHAAGHHVTCRPRTRGPDAHTCTTARPARAATATAPALQPPRAGGYRIPKRQHQRRTCSFAPQHRLNMATTTIGTKHSEKALDLDYRLALCPLSSR